jgi:hypothetical protein
MKEANLSSLFFKKHNFFQLYFRLLLMVQKLWKTDIHVKSTSSIFVKV